MSSAEGPRPFRQGEDVTRNSAQERIWPGTTVTFRDMNTLEKKWIEEDYRVDTSKVYSVRGLHSDDEEPFAILFQLPVSRAQEENFDLTEFLSDEEQFPFVRKAPIRFLTNIKNGDPTLNN